MHPVEFPQQNKKIAEQQDEYLTLPAFVDGGRTVSCWKVSFIERVIILVTGKLWLSQLNFSHPLQPQLVSARSPFIKIKKQRYI